MRRLVLPALLFLAAAGCTKNSAPEKSAQAEKPLEKPAPKANPATNQVARIDFNRTAAELNLPLFWVSDANNDSTLDPKELAAYWGPVSDATLGSWVKDGAFTPEFFNAYQQIAARAKDGAKLPDSLAASEKARRELVIKELAQGRPTLVLTDLRDAKPYEKRLVKDIVDAANIVEDLYAQQMGMKQFADRVPKDDPTSQMVFFRNHGYRCTAPKTQGNPGCSAIPSAPELKVSGLYPEKPLQQPGFCESLQKNANKDLAAPFTVVQQKDDGSLVAVPYTEAYGPQMKKISALLTDAAQGIPDGEEPMLKAYLTAAAQSFLDNNWVPADEAWAKMSVSNSKWYLRIGPDEVYAEPCSTKALFQVSFAKIDQSSLKWQNLLDPLKNDMEKAIASLSGKPYKARNVSFHLPDFIQIVLNAGDARAPSGATIGESLPNFGPVANEGRGRTVAMTNFYSDPDSLQAQKDSAQSLLCASVMPRYTTDPEPQLMSTVLHEAAHNLGPAHQYAVKGKIDREAFGGPLASMLEELKAQTAALYYADWLAARKSITQEDAERAHVRDLTWAFGHISRGMYDEEKHPRTYSQLAAIQLGMLMKTGAVSWHADELAANGTDKGCFALDLAKWPSTVKSMLTEVAGIKARGDRAGGEKLIKQYVDVTGELKSMHDVIAERMLRAPKASFVYAIEVE